MKPQDIVFLGILGILGVLGIRRRPIYLAWAGLLSLVFSVPLFAGWVFFTAERLVWYAAAFFIVFIIFFSSGPS